MQSDETEIQQFILNEMAVIIGRNVAPADLDKSLYDNGINSIRFVELLLSLQRQWHLDYLNELTMSGEDISTLRNFIRRVSRDAAGTARNQ